ncbi:MAG: tetratricopeptide repeat protein [Candidatus Latescibacterota bacterium]|nr:MAG: tetratricopeptide repeat protein [Candidatus Latescibacterota bacterium]
MSKKSKKKPVKKRVSKETTPQPDPYQHLVAPKSFARVEFAHIGVLFIIAFLVRTAYFIINKNNNPLFELPILDGLFHHEWAEDILSGNFWGDEVFFRAPLYPYFLAALYKIGGASIAFATLIQHVIGSLSVVLVYLLSRQYFSVRVALLAGVLASLYWPLIYFEGDLLIVTLVVFLDLLLLLSLSVAIKRQSLYLFVLSGVIFGISAIARPSILILALVLPVVFHYANPARRHKTTIRGSVWQKQTALVVAGALVVILPVIIRNYVVGRDFVPIASQGGVNFYIGNNPQSNGSQALVPGARADLHGTYQGAIELAEQDVGRKLKPSEVSNYYTRKAIDFITTSPSEAGALFAKKFYLFWAGVERSNNKYIQFFWQRFGLGKFPLPGFALVGPFALFGGVLLWRRRRRLSLLYLFVLSYMVGVVAFFVNARFRLPITPVLIIFAAYAFWHLFHAIRSKSVDLFKTLPILLVCVLIVDYDLVSFRGVRALDEAVSYYELGNAYLRLDEKEAALAEYEKAREIQEKYPTRGYMQIAGTIDYNLGSMYWEKGLYTRAIEALERVPDFDPRATQARGILADCYLKKGRHQDAIRTYNAILERIPSDARSLFGLGVAYRMVGKLDRSEEILRQVIEVHKPSDGSVNLELARTLVLKADLEGAIQNYQVAGTSHLQRRDAYLELARLHRRRGENELAFQYLSRLRELYPGDQAIEMELNALRRGR